MEKSPDIPSTTLVIFGITGDLSQRYLLPALTQIFRANNLAQNTKILGVTRQDVTLDGVLADQVKVLESQTELFQMDLSNGSDYQTLADQIKQIGSSQTIFYLVVPPAATLPIIRYLGEAGLNTPDVKLLLEKPFGTDLESAQDLIAETNKFFKEAQIYRIDHYLAKEMAQNVAVFLGTNVLFRDVWSRDFIEKIEVVSTESIGIEGRAAFYEQTGALRDIVQSHLLQLAALTLMEPCPNAFDFSELPERRLAALRHLYIDIAKFGECVVRGQYEGYRNEVNNPGSMVETFAAIQLSSRDPRWQGVPIHLVTGKKLDQKLTEIRVHFKTTQAAQANLLRLRIQPEEGISLDLWVKKPGYDQELQKLPLHFSYAEHFDHLPDAYEQVLVDAMRAKSNLFASSEEILETWRILQPVLHNWSMHDQIEIYQPGGTIDQVLKNQ
jgi:glucose-6-phosphate 1-dehydrogenase